MKTEIKVTLSSVEAAVLLVVLRGKVESMEKSSPMSELDNNSIYRVCLQMCMDLTLNGFNGSIE